MNKKDFESGQALIHKSAEKLQSKLVLVEGWLATIPGRVFTEVIHGDVRLSFRRESHNWRLFVQTGDYQEKLLMEAALAVKMQVVAMLPDLVQRMRYNQTELVAKLDQVTNELDEFIVACNKDTEI